MARMRFMPPPFSDLAGFAHEEIFERFAPGRDRNDAGLGGERGAQKGVHVRALGQVRQHAVRRLANLGALGQGGNLADIVAQANLGGQQARGEQLGQRPHVADAAGEDHGHPVAGHFHVGQDVRRVEHRAALALELEHEVADLLAPDGIEPGHGLVEHDQLGIAHQGLRDADALEHALGELAQGPAARVVEAHAGDEPGGALARRSARGTSKREPTRSRNSSGERYS
jgi:hypothetical protein